MENVGIQNIANLVEDAMAAEAADNRDLADEIWNRVTQGLEADPGVGSEPRVILEKVEQLRAQGAVAAAEALLGHMVRAYPEDLFAALGWAEAAFKRGDWQETLRRSALVRQRFANAGFAYVLAAQALREDGRLDEADAAFGEAVERFPADEGAAIQWADCAVRRSNLPEADRRYAQARERFPRSPFSYAVGAQVLRADGRMADADRLLTEAVDKFPDERQLHSAWTESARSLNDWAQAISRADISLRRFPESIGEILPIVNALIALGDDEKANAFADRCAAQFPNDRAVLTAWTEVAFKTGNRKAAQLRAACLLERFPDDQAAYYLSAASLREDGKAAEAIVVLEEGLRRFPQDLSLLREASQRLAELNRSEEAIALVDKALALQPDDAYFLHRRIQLALDLDDQVGAMAAWRRLAANGTADRTLCSDPAWSIFRMARAAEPALELLRYLVNEPDNGARDWLPRLADFAALSHTRPEMKAFARASLPQIESGPHVSAALHVLKSALHIDYTDYEILTFIRAYVAPGRSAITAYLFSRNYVREKPLAAEAFRRVFDHYIDRWLATARGEQFRNRDEILAYLMFSAIFSQSSYRRLIVAIAGQADITALDSDPGLRGSAGAVARLASLASRIRPSNAKAEAISRIRRLKIAVCVSGQLRGFARAFPTWRRLGLDRHDARYFVHSWANIGFDWRHFRALADNRDALAEIVSHSDCTTVLTARYPTAMAALGRASTVTVEQLQAFYGTSSVVVEHDGDTAFGDVGDAWKTRKNIACAHAMALASGDFDLFIRLRPDCEIMEDSKPDWNAVFHRSSYDRVIYADRSFEYRYPGCTIGDRFAAGCRDVMDIYSRAHPSTAEFPGNGESPRDLPDALDIGADLAYRTFHGGLLSSTVPDLKFGQLFDPEPLSLADLAPLIENDIAGRAVDEVDRAFLAVCGATIE